MSRVFVHSNRTSRLVAIPLKRAPPSSTMLTSICTAWSRLALDIELFDGMEEPCIRGYANRGDWSFTKLQVTHAHGTIRVTRSVLSPCDVLTISQRLSNGHCCKPNKALSLESPNYVSVPTISSHRTNDTVPLSPRTIPRPLLSPEQCATS